MARTLEFKKDEGKRHFAIEKWLKGESQETERRGPGKQNAVGGSFGFTDGVECLRHGLARTQITRVVPKLPYSDLGGWLLLQN